MAKANGPKYVVSLKRRRARLTDYSQRVNLLKSGKSRFVVRKTGKHVIVQLSTHTDKGDKILTQVNSKELLKYKWPERCNSPSAYLAGFLCAKKAAKEKITEAVLDIGLQKASKGNLIFSAVKGAIDGGLSIPMPEDMAAAGRMNGEHIAAYAKAIKGTDKYEKQFSSYLKEKVDPEKLPELFEKVKKEIGGSNA